MSPGVPAQYSDHLPAQKKGPMSTHDPRPALPELVTPAEVAALFGVDAKTVTRWIAHGRLPGVRTPSGHHRLRRTDIDRLLKDAGSASAPPSS